MITSYTKHIVRILALALMLFGVSFTGASAGPTLAPVAPTPPSSSVTVDLSSVYASKVVQEGQLLSSVANSINTLGLNYETLSIDTVLYAPTEISEHIFHSRLNRVDLIGSLQILDTSLLGLSAGADYKQFSALKPATAKTSQMEPFVTLTDSLLVPVYVTTRYNVPTRTTNLEGGAQYGIGLPLGFKVTPSAYVGYNDISNEYPHTLKAIKGWDRYYGYGGELSHNVLGGNLSAGVYDNLSDHTFTDTTVWYNISLAYRF